MAETDFYPNRLTAVKKGLLEFARQGGLLQPEDFLGVIAFGDSCDRILYPACPLAGKVVEKLESALEPVDPYLGGNLEGALLAAQQFMVEWRAKWNYRTEESGKNIRVIAIVDWFYPQLNPGMASHVLKMHGVSVEIVAIGNHKGLDKKTLKRCASPRRWSLPAYRQFKDGNSDRLIDYFRYLAARRPRWP